MYIIKNITYILRMYAHTGCYSFDQVKNEETLIRKKWIEDKIRKCIDINRIRQADFVQPTNIYIYL